MEAPISKYKHLRLQEPPPLLKFLSATKRRTRYLICGSILILFFVFINLWAFRILTDVGDKAVIGQPESAADKTVDNIVDDVNILDPENTHSHNNLQMADLKYCDEENKFKPDIDSLPVFPTLKFNLTSTPSNVIKYWWNTTIYNFEERYLSKFHPSDNSSLPPIVRVFVVPHSHNDPGWLRTFEEYFLDVKMILDNVVSKLSNYTDMTFVEREICFLDLWWSQATPEQRTQFKSLTEEGRLEILAGGWIMPDEATVDLYTMIQQMVEGNQWVKSHMGKDALGKVGWSIDPFGQGSSMLYLLKKAGVHRMVVGRLHFGWKEYLAEKQSENFNWVQRWDQTGKEGTICHNLEYDSYITSHTCGPQPEICANYDFYNRRASYYNETMLWQLQNNLTYIATDLVHQIQRTASLGDSHIVLFPVGYDFSFSQGLEWDYQYGNYTRLFSHINENKDKFGMEIGWGTVSSFFTALEHAKAEKNLKFPTFSGDFFPYADVHVKGTPAYWTGFYSTRPYWKRFHREVAAELRSAQILYSFTAQLVKGGIFENILRVEYKNVLKAGRNFALFTHHDGVTGTSKAWTMQDYGERLHSSYEISRHIQRICIRAIISTQMNISCTSITSDFDNDWSYEKFGSLPKQKERLIYSEKETLLVKKVVLFNSLSFKREEVVTVRITGWPSSQRIEVKGAGQVPIKTQINPVVIYQNGKIHISKECFDLNFIAFMDPLSVSIYNVRGTTKESGGEIAKVSCRGCRYGDESGFHVKELNLEQLSLESEEDVVEFNISSGLPSHIKKMGGRRTRSLPIAVQLGCYSSNESKFGAASGAYILQLEGDGIPCPMNQSISPPLVKQEGPLTSSITVYNPPFTIRTTIHRHLREKHIHLASLLDAGPALGEYLLRIDTDIDNAATAFTDQGGFTMEKRARLDKLGHEGNHYPITTMAYIQEKSKGVRISLGVNRPHGYALSKTPGRLEVMVERVTFLDDSRGMGESVMDNKPTLSEYVIIVEDLKGILNQDDEGYRNNLQTLNAHQVSLSLNYPLNQFGFDHDDNDAVAEGQTSFSLIKGAGFSPHTHLISLTTLPAEMVGEGFDDLNEKAQDGKALMILQRLGVLESCTANVSTNLFQHGMDFNLKPKKGVKKVTITDLAGVKETDIREHEFTNFNPIHGTMFEIFGLLVEFDDNFILELNK